MRAGTWRGRPSLTAAEQVALAFAEAVTATPPTIDDDLFCQLREHFDAPEIVEISAICAWENYRARLNRALGIEPHGFYHFDGTDGSS